MTNKRKVGIAAILALAAAVCFVWVTQREPPAAVSLVFQRYSNLDPWVADGEVAFLSLSNASNDSYLLTMTGNTNTMLMGNSFRPFKVSYMVDCEFRDETPGGTNSIQPAYLGGKGTTLHVGPHSGIIIRVPVPPEGQHRRVAVLCKLAKPFGPAPSWAMKPGPLALAYWRQRLLFDKLFSGKADLLKVWCDRDICRPEDGNLGTP